MSAIPVYFQLLNIPAVVNSGDVQEFLMCYDIAVEKKDILIKKDLIVVKAPPGKSNEKILSLENVYFLGYQIKVSIVPRSTWDLNYPTLPRVSLIIKLKFMS